MSVYFIRSGDSVNIVLEGEHHAIGLGHPAHSAIVEYLDLLAETRAEPDVSALNEILDVRKAIETFGFGHILVSDDGGFTYKGEKMQDCVTETIMEMLREGMDVMYLCRWYDKMMQNERKDCIESAWEWIRRFSTSIHICEDGDMLGYKSVRDSYMDWHSNSVLYKPGTSVSMERSDTDPSDYTACSYGFHVGSYDYANSFCSHRQGRRMVMMKFNPKHIVAVPHEGRENKIRVCEATTVAEIEPGVPLQGVVFKVSGRELVPVSPGERISDVMFAPTEKLREESGVEKTGTAAHWQGNSIEDHDGDFIEDDNGAF